MSAEGVRSGRRHVALVGLRCSGKTSVGRELARLAGMRFVDLDDEIVRAANASAEKPIFDATKRAGDVLATWGEPTFRSLESQALRAALEAREPCVLATGGGAVIASRNRALLAHHARCVWLQVDPSECARRLRSDPTSRPSLTGGDPAEELEQLAKQRGPLYAEVADVALDASSDRPLDLARRALERLAARE